MIKQSKNCLKKHLSASCDENEPPQDKPSTSAVVLQNAPSTAHVVQGLTISDSEDSDVEEMAAKFESKLIIQYQDKLTLISVM